MPDYTRQDGCIQEKNIGLWDTTKQRSPSLRALIGNGSGNFIKTNFTN